MKRFDRIRETFLPQIDRKIAEYLSRKTDAGFNELAQMAAYQFETGGKRLRALIPLMICDAYGRDLAAALAFGTAVEMIHNATLVHDDLQDGDEMRRGRPTVWKRFGEAQAINCGDAMFQFAIRMLAQMQADPKVIARLVDRASAGTLEVIEGQAQEMLMKAEPSPGVGRYLDVIRGKTAALFNLSITGAMDLVGASADDLKITSAAAVDLGVLFQIQDDLLDLYGAKGRAHAGTDIAEGKISVLVAHANQHATAQQKAELDAILRKPREKTEKADIDHALEIFESSGARKASIAMVRGIRDRFRDGEELNQCPGVRDVLIELADVFLEPIRPLL